MKELTANETTMVSGGFWQFFGSYLTGKAIDKALDLAAEKDDLFQDTNQSLPYNRL